MRNYIATVLLFTCAMTSSFSAQPNPLESYRWDHRIILLSVPPGDVEERVAELVDAEAAIEERQIRWFVLGGDSVATNEPESLDQDFQVALFRRYFAEQNGGTQVRLIGKDGGVKLRSTELDLQEIFTRIDRMPMRRAEMRAD